MNETQSLVMSIGEMSVALIGKDHVEAVNVFLDVDRSHALLTVALRENSDAEQMRAFDKFIDVEQMFFDDVSMELRLSDRESMEQAHASSKQLAYRA